ncbi:MAG: hypothetical protein KAQ93_04855 [Spirochaetales bacterium]|nr:hypothetical protein [Spirochaetales bacterium]
MKIPVISLILIFVISIFVNAEDSNPVLSAMQKNFARGSLSTKIQVLQNSAEYPDVNMGPLYGEAFEFILDNSKNLASDIAARELTILAVRLSGINGYSESAPALWQLFNTFGDEQVQVEILSALGELTPDLKVIAELNKWLKQQNDRFRSGTAVPLQVVAEAVVTLGDMGDSSSFPIVFSTGSAKYSDDITYKANQALKNLEGSYSQSLVEVIKSSVPSDKISALNLAIEDSEMPIEEKGGLYKMALDIGLIIRVEDSNDEQRIRELRYSAIRQLALLKWADASELIIEHFNLVILEYERGISPKSSVLEAVSCLGAIGTHEAAARLTLYLEFMNSYMENGQGTDLQISLAVMNNIGIIGDSIAFDDLLYSGYLDYPASVKRAAREALNNLKNR